MKTRTSSSLLLALTITAALVLAARTVPAQDSTTRAGQTAPAQLSYGVSQIIQLSKANVSEGTIVNYIQNSGNSYGLDADQIVYLKQQGVSDAVINTMLNQPRAGQTATTIPPQLAYPGASSAVTYVQPASPVVPAPSVYVVPDTQTYNYYAYAYHPYYGGYYYYPCYQSSYYYGGCYPSASFVFRFGGGHGGGMYHGGWHH
jgi:hypothetical protein